MSDLYLILHKVRGKPAFDIATPLQIGDEEGWIIPTSGHRAYPFQEWPISLLEDGVNEEFPTTCLMNAPDHPDWDDWPDHYQSTSPRTGQEITTDLLSTLGLTQPPKTFLRR